MEAAIDAAAAEPRSDIRSSGKSPGKQTEHSERGRSAGARENLTASRPAPHAASIALEERVPEAAVRRCAADDLIAADEQVLGDALGELAGLGGAKQHRVAEREIGAAR